MTPAFLLIASVLIFDTDSGFFADDGAALTMLMRSPIAPSVRGVTVVSGNVWAAKGVEYMQRNLRLLQRPDVPVYLGAQEPLVHTAAMVRKEGNLAFTGALGEAPVLANTAATSAIDFIIQTIDANPGNVTFVAIGPMTNLAIALRLRPDLAKKIGALLYMGGAVAVPGNVTKRAEFNFWFDPEAAQAVLRSCIPKKTHVRPRHRQSCAPPKIRLRADHRRQNTHHRLVCGRHGQSISRVQSEPGRDYIHVGCARFRLL